MNIVVTVILVLVGLVILGLAIILMNEKLLFPAVANIARPTGIFRCIEGIDEDEKSPDEWHLMDLHGKQLPYLHIKPPPTSVHIDDKFQKKFGVEYLLIFHGANWPTENCYPEYKEISNKFGLGVLVLEYPGFGTRCKMFKDMSTRRTMLHDYPLEVEEFVKQIGIPPRKIGFVAQCLGVPMAVSSLLRPYFRNDVRFLILTKPFTGFHDVMSAIIKTRALAKWLPISNVFHTTDQQLSQIKCPLMCVTGQADKVTLEEHSRELFDKVPSHPDSVYMILPDEDHDMRMIKALTLL